MKTIIKHVLLDTLLLSLWLYSHAAAASYGEDTCSYKMSGRILDAETKQPIPFATILITGTQHGTVANENGEFVLDKLCSREFNFECASVGYKTVTHHHDPYHPEPEIYMAPTPSELESVVVEAETIVGDMESMAVDQIGKSELSSNVTSSLGEVVGNIEGVTFTSTGSNVQLPVIHGLYGNRILIINNGVKHGFQNWSADHAPEIDIASADHIIVLKGAAGVKYGPEALGGVVLVNGDPLNLSEAFHGSAATGFETNGRGYNGNVQFGQGKQRFSYHVGANYIKIGDRHAPDYSLTNSGKEEVSANAGFRYHLANWDFKFYYSFIDQNLALLRSSVAESADLFTRSIHSDVPLIINDFSYDINEPSQRTQHHLAKATVDWNSNIGKFSLLLSQQINFREEYDVRRSAELPIIDLQLNTTDISLEWYHPTVGDIEGSIGIQHFYQDNDNNPGTNTTPFIPNYNTQRISAFVIESLKRGSTKYELGIRMDHEYNSVRGRETNQDIFRNTYSFTNVTASIGLVQTFSSRWEYRMNIGSAWRTPNMAELYSYGQHGFKNQYGLWRYYTDEDGDLKTNKIFTEEDNKAQPERGFKWINELSYQYWNQKFVLTAYSHYIENYIYSRPVAILGTIRGPMPTFAYDQTNAVFAGADITYTYTFSNKISTTIGGSYLWSKNVEKNESLINQPPANINLELSWQTPSFLGITFSKLSIKNSYTFKQYQAPRTVDPEDIISGDVEVSIDSEIFDFMDAPDGYFLTQAQWQWKANRLGGQIKVTNLLNNNYRDYLNQMRYFANDLGRNFLITVNYKF